MNTRVKAAFDEIHADDTLKDNTRTYLERQRQQHRRRRNRYITSLASAACLFLLCVGIRWLYFVPTTVISIDINPSIELGINRFNKVISIESYNDDGIQLARSLNVRFMDYTAAIDEILHQETVSQLMSNDELLTITLVGSEDSHCQKMLHTIQSATKPQKNTYCLMADADEVASAHEFGLSYGKYQALLKLQSIDPDITSDDIRDMTMREIHDCLQALKSNSQEGHNHNDQTETETSHENQKHNGNQGNKNHTGNGEGNGNGNGNGNDNDNDNDNGNGKGNGNKNENGNVRHNH